jgi:hypothetical protein
MDEARAVLARLDRIETLEREGAPPGVLLDELRGLVQAAEAWVQLEGDEAAKRALDRCEASLTNERRLALPPFEQDLLAGRLGLVARSRR